MPIRVSRLVNFQLDDSPLAQQARLLAAAFTSLGGRGSLLEQANREALQWIKQRAAGNLATSIQEHRRPQNYSTGDLRKAIFADASHIVNADGFEFMVADQVSLPYAFALEFGSDYWVGKTVWLKFFGRNPVVGRGLGGGKGARTVAQQLPSEDTSRIFNRRSDTQARMRFSHRPSKIRGNAAMGITGQYHASAHELVTDRIIGRREMGKLKSSYLVNGREFRVLISNPVPEYAYGRRAGETFLEANVYEKLILARFERFKAQLKVSVVPGASSEAKAKSTSKPKRARNPLKGRGKNGNVSVSTIRTAQP